MSDVENAEDAVSAESLAPPQPGLERLSKLPLEALLYYVLYGDERLTRLMA